MSNNSSLSNSTAIGQLLTSENVPLLLVLEVAAIPVIVCGNLLIIIAVVRFKSLRYASNVMIASLAFADLMMGGIYLPLKICLSQQPHWFSSRISCLANTFLSFFCVTNAMSFLALISAERFYAVQFPFHYHSYMTVTRSLVCSCLTFVMSIVIAIPSISGLDLWEPGKKCFSSNIMPRYYVSIGVFVVFLISLVGFVSFLRVMVAEIRFRRRDKIQDISETRKQNSLKSNLVLTVYVFSIICWIPQLVYTCISVFSLGNTSQVALRSVSLVGICSSGVNCFIYGIKNSKFKEAFKKMFGCKTSIIDVNLTTELNAGDTTA